MIDEGVSEPAPARRRLVLAGASAQIGLFAIVAGFWVVFASLAPGFLSPFNLFSLSRTLAVDIVIGFAQMVVLATGGMNLAVGAIGVCVVMATGWLIQDVGLPVPLAMAGALAIGGFLGWLNGVAIVRTGVNSFIITLASASLYLGAMLILTKAVPYSGLPPEVGAIGRMKIGTWLSPLLLVSVAIGAALLVLYRLTALGRQILAAGANPRAAAMSGVPVDRVIVISHTLSGPAGGRGGADGGLPPRRRGAFGRRRRVAAAVVPRAGARRHAPLRRRGGGGRHDDRRGARHHDPERAPGAAGRQLLAAALPRADPAPCGDARPVRRRLRRAPAAGAPMSILRRLLAIDWAGLAVAILLGAGALAVFTPNFLTEFNIYVMLRSFCVGLLVGFAQMVTLGVGQMNIAVGALGGLVAIAFGGMMEVWGVPLAASPCRWRWRSAGSAGC